MTYQCDLCKHKKNYTSKLYPVDECNRLLLMEYRALQYNDNCEEFEYICDNNLCFTKR